MKYKDYFENTKRTWADLGSSEKNLEHALLGLVDESGELAKQLKGHIAYGKPLLVHEGEGCIKEELGDMFYFLTRIFDEMGFKEINKIKTNVQLLLDGDWEERLKMQENVTQVGICYYISGRAGGMYSSVISQDGNLLVNA